MDLQMAQLQGLLIKMDGKMTGMIRLNIGKSSSIALEE